MNSSFSTPDDRYLPDTDAVDIRIGCERDSEAELSFHSRNLSSNGTLRESNDSEGALPHVEVTSPRIEVGDAHSATLRERFDDALITARATLECCDWLGVYSICRYKRGPEQHCPAADGRVWTLCDCGEYRHGVGASNVRKPELATIIEYAERESAMVILLADALYDMTVEAGCESRSRNEIIAWAIATAESLCDSKELPTCHGEGTK